jgi:hypothetical protein
MVQCAPSFAAEITVEPWVLGMPLLGQDTTVVHTVHCTVYNHNHGYVVH